MIDPKQRQLAVAYQTAFRTDAGQEVLAHLAKFCMEGRTTYTPGDTHQTTFNEGARTVIIEIRRWLDLDIEDAESKKPETAIMKENE